MSKSTSSYTASIGEGTSNQFRVPPPNMTPVNNGNLYNPQMNPAYYPYAAYTTPDQWVLNQAYFYNSWSYPQPPNTPPATLMQTPPPPLGTPPFPPNFNPGQPPPPPSEPPKMQPPPPPDTAVTPTKRGKSVYPRGGGRNASKGSNRMLKIKDKKDRSPTPEVNSTSSAGGDGDSSVNTDNHHVQVHKKAKRKPMSSRYTRKRLWCREDAEKVLKLENQSTSPASMLVIHFPDADLNSHMVKGFSPEIETVHFQIPYKARSCFVKLRQGANIEKVCEEISKIPFGMGFLRAELKHGKPQEKITNCEGIDPYTLYVGNLPANITVAEVKENFPTATYIDVGFAQKMKYTRYAFIQYATVEDAMEAYKKTINLIVDKRNLVVRFRRTKGNIGLPGDAKPPNAKKPKENDSDCEILGDDSSAFPKPVEEGNPDNKDNVLREAAQLMRKMLEKGEDFAPYNVSPDDSSANGPVVTIKTEKIDDENDDSIDSVDGDSDLLGTQVKNEPLDEFDNNDDCYSEVNEDEDDEIPPEYTTNDNMDDITFPNVDDDLDDQNEASANNWEDGRQKELEQVEEKPDISLLQSDFDKSNAYPRPGLSLSGLAYEQKDGLDDLFRGMNSDSDDDDDL